MKKINLSLLAIIALLSLSSCGNSDGSKMIDLEIRPRLTDNQLQYDEEFFHGYAREIKSEEYMDLFTVLPGPYEISWKYIYANTALIRIKLRLHLNKTLKPGKLNQGFLDDKFFDQDVWGMYRFIPFNEEGKCKSDYKSSEQGRKYCPLDRMEVGRRWILDEDEYSIVNDHDILLDFYHFLTSEPGTEYDLVLERELIDPNINKLIEHTKGFYIEHGVFHNNRDEWYVE